MANYTLASSAFSRATSASVATPTGRPYLLEAVVTANDVEDYGQKLLLLGNCALLMNKTVHY